MGGAASAILKTTLFQGKANAALTNVEQTLSLPELDADVMIHWDEHGSAHIMGRTPKDVCTAQGWVACATRGFQLEGVRRAVLGKLSELSGEALLSTDKMIRTFNWGGLGELDAEGIREKAKTDDIHAQSLGCLQGYCNGINAYMKQFYPAKLPVELALAGVTPEPWKVAHCYGVMRILNSQMGYGFFYKVLATVMHNKLGREVAEELDPGHEGGTYMCPNGGIEIGDINLEDLVEAAGGLGGVDPLKGSNSWAVSGSRTTTGYPILAGDPHLVISTPGFFWFTNLQALEPFGNRKFHVSGGSVVGLPGVIIGHNDHLTWSITLAFVDTEDVLEEHFTDASWTKYYYDNKEHMARVRVETIKVKGKSDVTIKCVETHNGPVISGVIPHLDATTAYSLRSTNLLRKPSDALTGMLLLNSATNFEQFREAQTHFDGPPLNMTYADTAGNIGYSMLGKIPIRPRPEMSTYGIVPGWTKEHDWNGWVPWDESPHVLNPSTGYVVSANHRIISPDFKWAATMGHIWRPDTRARRIIDLINSKQRTTLDDHQKWQVDQTSYTCLEWIAMAKQQFQPNGEQGKWLDHLLDWDGNLTIDSWQGALCRMWIHEATAMVLEPVLDEWLIHVTGRGYHAKIKANSAWKGTDELILMRILTKYNSAVLRRLKLTSQKVLSATLDSAVAKLKRQFGSRHTYWKWGDLHRLSPAHALHDRGAAIARIFDAAYEVPIGGDTNCVWMATVGPFPDMGCHGGPVMREVTDLSNMGNSRMINCTGNSGQLNHPNYNDQFPMWMKGEMITMPYTPEQVIERTKQTTALFALPYAVTVPRASLDKDAGVVYYRLVFETTGPSPRAVHAFSFRYREWAAFEAVVRAARPELPFPAFPPKTWTRRPGANADFLEYRRSSFEKWIQYVWSHATELVLDWVGLTPQSGPTSTSAGSTPGKPYNMDAVRADRYNASGEGRSTTFGRGFK